MLVLILVIAIVATDVVVVVVAAGTTVVTAVGVHEYKGVANATYFCGSQDTRTAYLTTDNHQ